MSDLPGRRTLAGQHLEEIDKIKGSRFWATVDQCTSIDAALTLVESVRAQWPDATHHCWAWRGQGRDTWRYADDGEPSGSAGKPILNAIDGRDLTDVAVVVTRYYGGTKLGVGGLVRAYGACAAAALDAAEIVFLPHTTTLHIRHEYTLSGTVQSVLNAHTVTPTAADYTDAICLTLVVPRAAVTGLAKDLRERCAGRISIDIIGDD